MPLEFKNCPASPSATGLRRQASGGWGAHPPNPRVRRDAHHSRPSDSTSRLCQAVCQCLDNFLLAKIELLLKTENLQKIKWPEVKNATIFTLVTAASPNNRSSPFIYTVMGVLRLVSVFKTMSIGTPGFTIPIWRELWFYRISEQKAYICKI